jgi:hypothetical protein
MSFPEVIQSTQTEGATNSLDGLEISSIVLHEDTNSGSSK